MKNKNHDRPTLERQSSALSTGIESIDQLDLGPIRFKLMCEPSSEIAPEAKAIDDAENLYRAFLAIVTENKDKMLVPTKIIDAFWHCHIMDTRKYTNDCSKIFGGYLHHFPYAGLRGEEDVANWKSLFENTKKVFLERFPELSFDAGSERGFASICSATACIPTCWEDK